MLLNNSSHSSRHRHHGGVYNDENMMSNPLSRSKTPSGKKGLSARSNNAGSGIYHDENSFVSKKAGGGKGGGLKKAPLGLSSSSSSLSNGGVTKTPKSNTGRRRALGDISNRKNANERSCHGLGIPSSTKPSKSKSVSFIAPQKAGVTPHKSGGGLAGVSSKTPLRSLSRKSSTKKKVPGSSSVMTPHRSGAEFVLPQQKKTVSFSIGKPKQASGGVSSQHLISESTREITRAKPVEDVEFPAGRLWEEEQKLIPDDGYDISFELDDCPNMHEIVHNQNMALARAAEERRKEADNALSEEMKQMGLDDMEDSMGGLDKSIDRSYHDYSDDLHCDHWERETHLNVSLSIDDDLNWS